MSKGILLALGALGVGYLVLSGSSDSSSSGGSSSGPGPGPDPAPDPNNLNSSSGCPGNLPKALGSTDFDGMPAEFRTVYEAPLKLTPVDVSSVTKEPAALGALTLASQARCAGYTAAAKKLEDMATTIRSWNVGSGYYG